LYVLHSSTRPWYADLVNYLVTKEFPLGLSTSQKKCSMSSTGGA
jgi:hypothetical protein